MATRSKKTKTRAKRRPAKARAKARTTRGGARKPPAPRRAKARRGRHRASVTPFTRVTGIGGIFFRSDDPGVLMEWYRKHLGIPSDAFGGWAFQWRDKRRSQRIGYTVFSPFKKDTTYFDPSEKSFMFNFRVADLRALLAQLRREGIHVVDEIQELPYGKFGWIIDPEGNKIELWEPPDVDDPFSENQA
jgi:predicted enzyme related to lactoylglutathione lyase